MHLVESPHTFHYVQIGKEGKKKKKKEKRQQQASSPGRQVSFLILFYSHTLLLIQSHVMEEDITDHFTFSQDNKKSQFQKQSDICHKFRTHIYVYTY